MLELGHKSAELHKDISKVINNSDIDKVFIKGNKTLNTYKNINTHKIIKIFLRLLFLFSKKGFFSICSSI